jgi:hypothetical protein
MLSIAPLDSAFLSTALQSAAGRAKNRQSRHGSQPPVLLFWKDAPPAAEASVWLFHMRENGVSDSRAFDRLPIP